jgi:hypothetical protein
MLFSQGSDPRVRGRLAQALLALGGVLCLVGAFVSQASRGHYVGAVMFLTGWSILVVGFTLFGVLEKVSLLRLIEDLPTARIRSAPQGYVELEGFVQPGGDMMTCPACEEPCYWYQYYPKNSTPRTPVGRSPDIVIDDGTGRCLVRPAGAELMAAHGRAREPGHVHIGPGDLLLVLGEFRTRSSAARTTRPVRVEAAPAAQPASALRRKLQELKADPKRMAMMDVNRDGTVDQKEWEAARRATEMQLEREGAPADLLPASEIGQPLTDRDRLPFLIHVGTEQEALRSVWNDMARRVAGFLAVGGFLAFALVSVAQDVAKKESRRAAAAAAASASGSRAPPP